MRDIFSKIGPYYLQFTSLYDIIIKTIKEDVMRILVIRHGDPNYEIDSLTDRGFKEAELLSQRLVKLNPTEIYCSELGRAQRTAEPTVAKTGIQPVLCNWLIEYPLSAHISEEEKESGRKWLTPWEIKHKEWIDNPNYCNYDAWLKTERFENCRFDERQNYIGDEFDKIMASKGLIRNKNSFTYQITEEYEKHKDEILLFFCHFGLSLALTAHLLPISPAVLWNGFNIDPTGITEFMPDRGGKDYAILRCMRLNDTSHLANFDELPPPCAPREYWYR